MLTSTDIRTFSNMSRSPLLYFHDNNDNHGDNDNDDHDDDDDDAW